MLLSNVTALFDGILGADQSQDRTLADFFASAILRARFESDSRIHDDGNILVFRFGVSPACPDQK